MKTETTPTFTAFLGQELLASGPLSEVALALHSESNQRTHGTSLVFDDETGNPVELDVRGTAAEVAARYVAPSVSDQAAPAASAEAPATPVRGRPRLGVIAREVTLLPEHWDWLAAQPGGASVALRKLVHEARKANVERDQQRRAHERAYRVMSATAGNLPGFEEASRALFAGDLDRLAELAHAWPADIRNYIVRLATSDAARTTG